MAVSHTFDDGAVTVHVRAASAPTTRHAYATVLHVEGPHGRLLRRCAEAAVTDALATRRAASWVWLDDDVLSIRYTREDPEYAAEVVAEVLSTLERRYAEARESAEDEAFDTALRDRLEGR